VVPTALRTPENCEVALALHETMSFGSRSLKTPRLYQHNISDAWCAQSGRLRARLIFVTYQYNILDVGIAVARTASIFGMQLRRLRRLLPVLWDEQFASTNDPGRLVVKLVENCFPPMPPGPCANTLEFGAANAVRVGFVRQK
jgi:hypothetical protein